MFNLKQKVKYRNTNLPIQKLITEKWKDNACIIIYIAKSNSLLISFFSSKGWGNVSISHTKASIFVLVWKSSSLILFKILDDLNPLMVVFDLCSFPSLLEVKSTVSGFEQEGQEFCPMLAPKSIKQGLQKACPHDVTCCGPKWVISRISIHKTDTTERKLEKT